MADAPPARAGRPLNIVQAVTCINEATGGPAVSVTGLASALARLGHRCSIVALDYRELGPPRSADPADVELHPMPFAARRVADWSPALKYMLLARTRDGADVVHNHGLWLLPNRYARLAARRAGVPLVISPRGMLEPWARGRSRLKKWLVWQLFESANIHAAAAFHATSLDEARSIRDCGIRAPIAVIPNGIADSMLSPRGDAPARTLVPGVGRQPYILFMSRLHPKKGLENLLAAWRDVQREYPEVRLLVAGPDLDGYRPLLERRARELDVSGSVIFHAALDGDAKSAALVHAELFVLPSFSENFGIVVGEALAHGLPVITTTGTPWRSLREQRCGWWIEPTVDGLTGALREGLSLSATERAGYAERARALVRGSYSWDAIAGRTVEFYRWIRDDGCRASTAPEFLAE